MATKARVFEKIEHSLSPPYADPVPPAPASALAFIQVCAALELTPGSAHPMDVLRTAEWIATSGVPVAVIHGTRDDVQPQPHAGPLGAARVLQRL